MKNKLKIKSFERQLKRLVHCKFSEADNLADLPIFLILSHKMLKSYKMKYSNPKKFSRYECKIFKCKYYLQYKYLNNTNIEFEIGILDKTKLIFKKNIVVDLNIKYNIDYSTYIDMHNYIMEFSKKHDCELHYLDFKEYIWSKNNDVLNFYEKDKNNKLKHYCSMEVEDFKEFDNYIVMFKNIADELKFTLLNKNKQISQEELKNLLNK